MISYSAQIVLDSAGDLVVLAGTVFNQVLVWYVSSSRDCPGEGDKVDVRLTLNGHDVSMNTVLLIKYNLLL